MHSTSIAFGLSLSCLFAFQSASCTSPIREDVSPPPVLRADPPSAAPASPAAAPDAGVSEAKPESAQPAEAELETAKPADAKPADAEPLSETHADANSPELSSPAAPTPAPIQLLRPEAQPAQVTGPAPAVSKPAVEDSQTSIFGEPLYVNGKRVTDDQIKLFLIYGPCRTLFELARNAVVIEDELRRRAVDATEAEIKRREGEKPFGSPDARKAASEAELKNQLQQLHEKNAVSDVEIQKEIDRMVTDFKKNYPALDLDAEVNRAYRTADWYQQQLRQSILFDHVFLPDNPDEWPVVTTEAVRADSGDVLIEDAYDSYKNRKEMAQKYNADQRAKAEEAKTKGQEFHPDEIVIAKEDPFFMGMMRDIVRMAVYKLVDFKSAGDGLPDTTALWADTDADGKPELVVSTDELWNQVKETVSQTEIDEAKQWFVTSIATHDRLEKDGFLLNPGDCSAALTAREGEFENATFNLETLATSTYYFPSVQTYREYYCMMEGFKKLNEPRLKPGPGGEVAQVLRDYYDRATKIMGLGQIDVEVLLVAAFDIGKFRWKQNGWEWAKNKAAEIYSQVESNTREYNEQRAKILEAKAKAQEYKPEKEVLEPYRFWTQMMDDHCEYWDPPAPEEKGKMSMVGMKMRGRFGPHYRNDLNTFIGETYYSNWVTGRSITDYVFFDQAEGTVAGPFKGPQGYYITRVLRRTPPTRSLNLSEPKHLELLRDDWLRVGFVQYAKEAVAGADVKGFAKDS
jgi:hypothetical protein